MHVVIGGSLFTHMDCLMESCEPCRLVDDPPRPLLSKVLRKFGLFEQLRSNQSSRSAVQGEDSNSMRLLQVRAHFRPEFVNRIDDFIVFQGLQRSQIERIARLQAKRVEQRLAAKKIKMRLEDSAVQFLAVCTARRCSLAVHPVLCYCTALGCRRICSLIAVLPAELAAAQMVCVTGSV